MAPARPFAGVADNDKGKRKKETAPLMGSMVSIYIFGQDNTPISELAQRHVRLADDGRMRLAA
jgi:hypothetical protein